MAYPPLNDLQSLRRQAEAEQVFWQQHYQEFQKKYPDQLVAVHDGQIVGVKYELEEIITLIRERGY